MSRIEIRPLENHAEFGQCERIQIQTWGNLGVSAETLAVNQKYGGVVMGALVDGKLAGFIYAFLGRRHGRLIHWSHLMAVAPRQRDHGLGFRMKLAHRELALRQGIKSICWTYDPLQSRNASLNIARLGGHVDEYIRNCYGNFPSRIELGLDTDRFVVDWRISTRSVDRRLKAGPYPLGNLRIPRANETSLDRKGFRKNQRLHLDLNAPRILVEIPPNPDEMRYQDLGLAKRWRVEARAIFENYLRMGYSVWDFVSPARSGEGRSYYLLRRLNPRD
jgi:predicted GNAT superfamily acetyltransferase